MSFQKQIAVLFLGATLAFGSLAAPFLSQSAYAQTVTTGDIVGRITDPTGATVAGATVKLTSLDTDAVTTVVTSEDGSFRFPLLRPGNYALVVEGHGLSADVKSATVNVGSATRLDIKAQPVGAAQTVEVTATSEALLQPDNANITTTYDTEQLALLPIPGGDISNIPFTAPGVNLSTGAGYGAFTAFGVSATSNLFTLNGNDTMDPYNNLNNSGASNLTLGANEVQEVAVVSNGYSGQYGRMAGAQVNFTTLAGTNKFHGNAVYYWNGTVLNANDWFNVQTDTPIPHAVSNQWATRVGGPIIKNKLFFFADYEGLRYVLPGGGPTYTPSPAFQAATLSNLALNNASQVPWYTTQFNLYNTGPGASRATAVTTALDQDLGCGDFSGTTYAGQLYGSTYDADGNVTATGLPCAYTFQNTAGSLNTEALYSVRIDQVIGAKDQINYRYKHDWGVQATGTDPINSAFNANSVQPQWEGQLNETHTFSPTMTNNFIMSGSYYSAIFGPPDINAALSVFPTTILPLDGLGFAYIGGTDYNYPQGRRVTQYQFVDDLSIIKGKNAVKVGVNFRRNDITDLRAGVLSSGRTEFFSNTDYFNGVLNRNTGSLIQQRFALNQEAPINTYTLGFYAQDEYAATPQLKLTFALRFDRNANPTCTDNCFNRFYSDFGNIDHSVTTPYNTSIKTGLSNAFPAIDPILVQPRFGFAYSPESQGGKTVIRGGIGLFSDLIPAQLVDQYILNAPGVTNFTVTATGADIPVAMGTPGNGYDIAAQSNAAFQSGFANGATLADLTVATNGHFSTPAFSSIVDKLKNPTYLEYNLEWQQQVGQFDAIDINYVGNYAYNVLQNNATPNAYAACATASPVIPDPNHEGQFITNPNYCPGGFGGLPNAQVDRRFKIITNLTNMGHANYNGVTASYKHHIRYGLMLNANYAWSHDLDTCSNGCLNEFNLGNGATYFNTQVNPSGNNLNYGNADYDIRQSFSLNYVWQMPFKTGNHFANAIVAGWTLSGTLYSRTGYPYSVYNSKIPGNLLGSRSGGTVLAGHISGKSAKCGNGNDVCLLKDQFATSATQYLYGFGNQSRNSYRGPMYFDTDANIAKTTPIKEGVNFKIGANFFNILNHPNFASPTNDVTSGSFGAITSTVTPPSSPYGSFTGSAVSGRIVQIMGSIQF